MTSTYILGISAYYHDSAACLVRDGEIVAAGQEERFTRKKGDASFPQHAVAFCLKQAGITAADLTHVVETTGRGTDQTTNVWCQMEPLPAAAKGKPGMPAARQIGQILAAHV